MSHHHSYYARKGISVSLYHVDGVIYSPEELDAYGIPSQLRDRCVNHLVPLKKCRIATTHKSVFG
jgi:hypothetical protein